MRLREAIAEDVACGAVGGGGREPVQSVIGIAGGAAGIHVVCDALNLAIVARRGAGAIGGVCFVPVIRAEQRGRSFGL